jgi:protein-S-isoprenylcysteine O-methyltransferase Ste14
MYTVLSTRGDDQMNSKNDHAQIVLNPFLVYFLLALCAVLLQRFYPLPAVLPGQVPRMIVAAIMSINLMIGLAAVRSMLTARTSLNPHRPTTALILSGPFRFTRNPLYLGLTVFYVGLMLVFELTWGLLLLPFVIWLITIWVIVPEEKYLEQKFGADYLDYKSRVRRWI